MLKLRAYLSWIAVIFFVVAGSLSAEPRNVILFIGDGMGPEQVDAAGYYLGDLLSFETLPYQGEATTYSASSSVTDSAAAATAIATGVKVNNGVISIATPGDGSELYTLLEYFRDAGKSVGLVTTTYMTHATPAAFGAHESSRNSTSAIGDDYIYQTIPNVIFGGGGNGMSTIDAANVGYVVVTDRDQLLALDTSAVNFVSGQFGSSHLPYELDGMGTLPHLSEMTTVALDILDDDPDGFFLMVEGGRIDHACHSNDIVRAVLEAVEFSNAVQIGIDWAVALPDTLVLVTADHETGGLTVTGDNGPGNFPDVTWSTTGHTGVNVGVYAWGTNAEYVAGEIDNTDIFEIILAQGPTSYKASEPDPADGVVDVALNAVLSWTPGYQASSHNVYFGPTSEPVFIANQSGNSYDSRGLEYDTLYYWRIDELSPIGVTAGDVYSFTTMSASEVNTYNSDGETLRRGIIFGSYLDTHVSDDQYEVIEEEILRKGKNSYSALDNIWTFGIEPSEQVRFYLEAYRPAGTDSDDFLFSYSTDGSIFTNMFTVSKIADDDVAASYDLPAGTGPVLYIRVVDTNHTRGNTSIDSLYVDNMYVVGSGVEIPCTAETMIIASIVKGTLRRGKGFKYSKVTVNVVDNCGEPVAGATVTGTFKGDFNETIQAVTDSQGNAVFIAATQVKKPRFSFKVDTITHPVLTY